MWVNLFFLGWKISKKTHTKHKDYAFHVRKSMAWLYQFVLPWGPPSAPLAHYKYLGFTVREYSSDNTPAGTAHDNRGRLFCNEHGASSNNSAFMKPNWKASNSIMMISWFHTSLLQIHLRAAAQQMKTKQMKTKCDWPLAKDCIKKPFLHPLRYLSVFLTSTLLTCRT